MFHQQTPISKSNPAIAKKTSLQILSEAAGVRIQKIQNTLLFSHSVAIGNSERHVRKASHRGSKQQ